MKGFELDRWDALGGKGYGVRGRFVRIGWMRDLIDGALGCRKLATTLDESG